MMGALALIPFLLIIVIFVLLMFGKTFSRQGIFSINRKFHFIVAFSFIGVLFIMTILAELLYPTSQEIERPPHTEDTSPSRFQAYNKIENDIIAGSRANSSLLVASRTHKVDEQLEITYSGEFYDFPLIYVERSEEAENTIEEYVYKPFMFVNDYDYTDKLDIHLPTWGKDTMTISNMVDFNLNLTEYSDASLFKQFTSEGNNSTFSSSFGSSSATPIIHLIVPKDLEVIAPFDDVMFVEELREEQ